MRHSWYRRSEAAAGSKRAPEAAPARLRPWLATNMALWNSYFLFGHWRAGLRPLDIGLGGIAPLAGSANNSDK